MALKEDCRLALDTKYQASFSYVQRSIKDQESGFFPILDPYDCCDLCDDPMRIFYKSKKYLNIRGRGSVEVTSEE